MGAARFGALLEDVEKTTGPIDGEHAPRGPNDIREVERRVARPATDVDDGLAAGKSRPLPGVVRLRAPHGVLQAESIDLVVMSAEDVVALSRGWVRHGEKFERIE